MTIEAERRQEGGRTGSGRDGAERRGFGARRLFWCLIQSRVISAIIILGIWTSKSLHGQGADVISRFGQDAGASDSKGANAGNKLRPINQREPFLGFETSGVS